MAFDLLFGYDFCITLLTTKFHINKSLFDLLD